jgi:hypothetical protein
MFGDPSSFTWFVPTEPDAFRVEKCTIADRQEPALVFQDHPARAYRPLAEAVSLYRALASVPPSADGVLEFARRYGRLGIVECGTLPDGSTRDVEPLRQWRRVIALLGEAIRLWDLAAAGSRAGLAKVILWKKASVCYKPSPQLSRRLHDLHRSPQDRVTFEALHQITAPWQVRRSKAGSLEAVSPFKPGDVIEPAKCLVLKIVNEYLGLSCQPGLLWSRGKDGSYKPVMCHYPHNLLGVIFLQFSTAILSDKVSRTCAVCGRAFELTTLASRSDRLLCSNRCKVKSYRDRQHKARSMLASGKSIKQIAALLGSTVETVSNWVSHNKE